MTDEYIMHLEQQFYLQELFEQEKEEDLVAELILRELEQEELVFRLYNGKEYAPRF